MSDEKELHEAYQDKLQAQLEELEGRISLLKVKAENANMETRIDAREQIQQAKEQYEEAEEKIKNLQSKTESTWQDLQPEIEETMQGLMESVNEAILQFRDGKEVPGNG